MVEKDARRIEVLGTFPRTSDRPLFNFRLVRERPLMVVEVISAGADTEMPVGEGAPEPPQAARCLWVKRPEDDVWWAPQLLIPWLGEAEEDQLRRGEERMSTLCAEVLADLPSEQLQLQHALLEASRDPRLLSDGASENPSGT